MRSIATRTNSYPTLYSIIPAKIPNVRTSCEALYPNREAGVGCSREATACLYAMHNMRSNRCTWECGGQDAWYKRMRATKFTIFTVSITLKNGEEHEKAGRHLMDRIKHMNLLCLGARFFSECELAARPTMEFSPRAPHSSEE